MTRLDAIKGRAQVATEGCTAGTPADYAFIRHAYADVPWLLAQVEALADALRFARNVVMEEWDRLPATIRKIDAALATLEAPDARV